MLTACTILAAMALIAKGAAMLSQASNGVEVRQGFGLALIGLSGTAAGFIAVFNGGF